MRIAVGIASLIAAFLLVGALAPSANTVAANPPASLTEAAMASGSERERDDMLDPAGWDDNEKVSIELVGGRVYHGYLFNRSHLLAKSLGSTETLANLITATRTQNVGSNNAGGTGMGGMAYTEQLARLPRRPSTPTRPISRGLCCRMLARRSD